MPQRTPIRGAWRAAVTDAALQHEEESDIPGIAEAPGGGVHAAVPADRRPPCRHPGSQLLEEARAYIASPGRRRSRKVKGASIGTVAF